MKDSGKCVGWRERVDRVGARTRYKTDGVVGFVYSEEWLNTLGLIYCFIVILPFLRKGLV